jgi:hypothetical protein
LKCCGANTSDSCAAMASRAAPTVV